MKNYLSFVFTKLFLGLVLVSMIGTSCREANSSNSSSSVEESVETQNPFEAYLATPDEAFSWEKVASHKKDGYEVHIIRMVSQKWMTKAEVKDPTWWHWLTLVVPDEVKSSTGLMFIGGGNRKKEEPDGNDEILIQTALATQTVTASLHNIPNQATEFVGDDYGPRVEDELIAYGWRKFLEGGAKDEDAIWLARFPMTKAVMRAMDVITEFTGESLEEPVDKFVVAGGSKRGWTTWTTAAMDKRVVGIVPLVIDMLNTVESFEHHWQAYGRWADAVGDYEHEGIMEWQGSKEYDRLLELTEPYSYLDRYENIPKLIVNAAGDQFFLPDSWQFYWKDLPGEKHLRYIPNTDHSLRDSDAIESLIAFYQGIVNNRPRPEWEWEVVNGTLEIQTNSNQAPVAIKLWQAHNPDARNFQLKTIGKAYSSTDVPISDDGKYSLKIDAPESGYAAFFAELTFSDGKGVPLKVTTGTVVTPDTYPFEPFVSKSPKGTK